jgi:hypothetical protein
MIRQSTCVSWSPRRFFVPALILLTFSVLFLSQPACSETVISASINQNTNWDVSGSPYHVTAAITLAAGYRLTIQPGPNRQSGHLHQRHWQLAGVEIPRQ